MNETRITKENVVDIYDVADWFLLKEPMCHKKVQKLCYYAEAWSEALLNDTISKNAKFQAWIYGPINKELWQRYKDCGWGSFEDIDTSDISESVLAKFSEEQLVLLEDVWDVYGKASADQLEIHTYKEKPWVEKRVGLGMFKDCTRIISKKTMRDYYGSLVDD